MNSRPGTDLSGSNTNFTGPQAPFTLQRRADLNPVTAWQDAGPINGTGVTIPNAFSGAQGFYRVQGQ
ncbi:MAG: hypothetical protein E6L09_12965 [Verrucomicrobia bacterium]|nr:MAG: hypothetical protein E6L09_12965 [Verrucomicrobiota bacterium]